MGQSLADRYDNRLAGMLSCYDRVVITGTLPGVCYADGMTRFLHANGIRIFDYPQFAMNARANPSERARLDTAPGICSWTVNNAVASNSGSSVHGQSLSPGSRFAWPAVTRWTLAVARKFPLPAERRRGSAQSKHGGEPPRLTRLSQLDHDFGNFMPARQR